MTRIATFGDKKNHAWGEERSVALYFMLSSTNENGSKSLAERRQ